jgi:hypothetical protein
MEYISRGGENGIENDRESIILKYICVGRGHINMY